MKYLVLCVSLNFLFFINTVYSSVSIAANYDDVSKKSVNFNVKQAFHISCNVTTDGSENFEVTWEKNGEPVTEIEGLKNKIKQSHEGNIYKLRVGHAIEADAGNYSCHAGDSESIIQVTSNIAVKVHSNVNVVEGEKLKLHCLVLGNPYPELHWVFINDTDGTNETYRESKDRVTLEEDPDKKIKNAIFNLNDVRMGDRGEYICIGESAVTGKIVSSRSMIRIKDKLAAVWPFLGICAEVIILCAVIFIYEKKRNKTELEESDTDQSPDQKNTPDNGKDSNLRHRQ